MNSGLTIARALSHATRQLTDAGIENARSEARLLICHSMGVGPETVIGHPERELDEAARSAFDLALIRRGRREPMSHLTGRREFWSLGFHVTSDTLDPRPDSETVIEAALGEISDRAAPVRILDLGTGSGCLLLALLSELPGAIGVGADISAAALDTARLNAMEQGVSGRTTFQLSNWDIGIDGKFDVILSNPPYIPSQAIDGLAPEVAKYEPRAALDGGADGLAAYRSLAPAISRRLRPEGLAFIELGVGQAGPVMEIMADATLDNAGLRNDLCGISRCLVLRLMP